MTAQLANGGYKIYPKVTINDKDDSLEDIKLAIKNNSKDQKKVKRGLAEATEQLFKLNKEKKYERLYKSSKNIRIIQEAMFASTNELRGTSYKSRIDDPKYQFAGKTGTAQVKRITERDRELDLKTIDIPYDERDHALYVAFGPYKNPRYALSIVIEHGGSGSSTAAPIAKKLFKLIIDRHQFRAQTNKQKEFKI